MPRQKVAETGDSGPQDRWHITRGVPVALIVTFIVTIFGQTVGGSWYLAQLVNRVDVLEKAQEKAQILVQPNADRLTRLEEKVGSLQASSARIEAAVTALSLVKTR